MRRRAGLLAVVGGLLGLLAGCRHQPAPQPSALDVLCAPALRPPVEALLSLYQQRFHQPTQVAFEASNVLLGQLKVHPHGDVLLPADRSYVDEAVKLKLACEPRPLVWLTPVLLVRRGNPRHVTTLKDLAQPGLRVGVGDPRTAAIGRTTDALLKQQHLESVAEHAVLHAQKVDELGNALKLGALDATVVWDVVARNYPVEAEAVPLAGAPAVAVSGALVSGSPNAAAARRFLDLATSDEGRALFARFAYRTQPPAETGRVAAP